MPTEDSFYSILVFDDSHYFSSDEISLISVLWKKLTEKHQLKRFYIILLGPADSYFLIIFFFFRFLLSCWNVDASDIGQNLVPKTVDHLTMKNTNLHSITKEHDEMETCWSLPEATMTPLVRIILTCDCSSQFIPVWTRSSASIVFYIMFIYF